MRVRIVRIMVGLAAILVTLASSSCERGADQSGEGAGSRRARPAGGEVVTIRWHGSRGMPGPDAIIPDMLEELITGKVGFPVEFELTGTDDGNHHPQLETMLAASDLPDCFLYMGLSEDFLSEAAAKIELPEMFTYMPELTKYFRELMNQLRLNEIATWNIYIDDADGMMWGVPRTWDYGWVPNGQMWRKDLLDEMGYEIPTTIAEAEAVFTTYKAYFPSKYAMGGSGKQPDWQCFDIVFNAYGIVAGGQHESNGKLRQFYATPEFREALIVLRRWYDKGFIDPDFINDVNLDKFRKFGRGEYLVTEWISRGSWPVEDGGNVGYAAGLRNVPGALAVPATHIAADEYARPIQRVWNPFLRQVTAFGKHLENDHEKIHQIMQVADLISQDRDVKFLSNFGIEGVHYEIEEGETAPTGLPVSGSPMKTYGYGYYWAGTFAGKSMLRSKDQKIIDDYVIDPNGIYGSYNLDLWYPIIRGPVTYETRDPVEASTPTSWFEMVVAIVTDERPLEYYDEWLTEYYDSGGRDWEEHATRLYGP